MRDRLRRQTEELEERIVPAERSAHLAEQTQDALLGAVYRVEELEDAYDRVEIDSEIRDLQHIIEYGVETTETNKNVQKAAKKLKIRLALREKGGVPKLSPTPSQL